MMQFQKEDKKKNTHVHSGSNLPTDASVWECRRKMIPVPSQGARDHLVKYFLLVSCYISSQMHFVNTHKFLNNTDIIQIT